MVFAKLQFSQRRRIIPVVIKVVFFACSQNQAFYKCPNSSLITKLVLLEMFLKEGNEL